MYNLPTGGPAFTCLPGVSVFVLAFFCAEFGVLCVTISRVYRVFRAGGCCVMLQNELDGLASLGYLFKDWVDMAALGLLVSRACRVALRRGNTVRVMWAGLGCVCNPFSRKEGSQVR